MLRDVTQVFTYALLWLVVLSGCARTPTLDVGTVSFETSPDRGLRTYWITAGSNSFVRVALKSANAYPRLSLGCGGDRSSVVKCLPGRTCRVSSSSPAKSCEVRVEMLDVLGPTGHFQIWLDEVRKMSDSDAARLRAERMEAAGASTRPHDPTASLIAYREALQIWSGIPSPTDQARALIEISKLQLETGKMQEAIESLSRALRTVEKHDSKGDYIPKSQFRPLVGFELERSGKELLGLFAGKFWHIHLLP